MENFREEQEKNLFRMTGVVNKKVAQQLISRAKDLGIGASTIEAGKRYPLPGTTGIVKSDSLYYAIETRTPEQCTAVWNGITI